MNLIIGGALLICHRMRKILNRLRMSCIVCFYLATFPPRGLILLSTAVTHELVRCIETEEVSRVQEHERHSKFIVSATTIEMNLSIAVHHIQHHMQPIIAREELPEEHTDHVSIH